MDWVERILRPRSPPLKSSAQGRSLGFFSQRVVSPFSIIYAWDPKAKSVPCSESTRPAARKILGWRYGLVKEKARSADLLGPPSLVRNTGPTLLDFIWRRTKLASLARSGSSPLEAGHVEGDREECSTYSHRSAHCISPRACSACLAMSDGRGV